VGGRRSDPAGPPRHYVSCLVSAKKPEGTSAFMALAPGNYGRRLASIFIPSLDPMGSASSRQEILNRSIIVSLRNPISGIGMGNFHTVSLHETVTHNAFTQISAEMGLAALIAYMMFLTGPILRLRRIERNTFERPEERRYYYLAVGLQASLIGYMVSAFFAGRDQGGNHPWRGEFRCAPLKNRDCS